MSLYDAPNQQVVRGDGSGPADEGTGGSVAQDPLDAMTKAELLEHAERQGLDVDDSMTKAEIREAIDQG